MFRTRQTGVTYPVVRSNDETATPFYQKEKGGMLIPPFFWKSVATRPRSISAGSTASGASGCPGRRTTDRAARATRGSATLRALTSSHGKCNQREH